MARAREVETADAIEAGYPVTVALDDIADGELILTRGGEHVATFTVERGRATASTRGRLDELLALGGRTLVLPDADGDTGGTPS